jgi:predicted ABC-type ATPase
MINRRFIIIAGPNGAGKTTFARALLTREADRLHFINADLFALCIASLASETAAMRAGRPTRAELDRRFAARERIVCCKRVSERCPSLGPLRV